VRRGLLHSFSGRAVSSRRGPLPLKNRILEGDLRKKFMGEAAPGKKGTLVQLARSRLTRCEKKSPPPRSRKKKVEQEDYKSKKTS